MSNDVQHMGDRLRAEMERRNMTAADVARIFDVKGPSVYDWINFGRIAKKHLPKLMREFGHTMEWWLSGIEGDENSHKRQPMSDTPQEPKNLVLVKLDQVLVKLDGLHEELRQIKVRLTSVERGVNTLNESTTAQWEVIDKYEERLRALEAPH